MANVLVVWCELPEEVSFVQLTIPNENLAAVKRWHNHFINGTTTPQDIQDEILKAFYNDGEFLHKKIKTPLTGQVFDLVIVTGFIL